LQPLDVKPAANAGPMVIATITIIRAATVTNKMMRLIEATSFPREVAGCITGSFHPVDARYSGRNSTPLPLLQKHARKQQCCQVVSCLYSLYCREWVSSRKLIFLRGAKRSEPALLS
jgi:hypothetical protein